MINRSIITINSRFGREANSMFLSHSEGSRNLAILFPGRKNSTDVPTLYYARKAALLAGCDFLSLEYGYRANVSTMSRTEIIDTVKDECLEVINRCMKKEYERIFFISKSMGHFFSLRITDKFDKKIIKHICYTPIDEHVIEIVKNECIVFTGTKDKLLSEESRNELAKYSNVVLIQVENAVHSLEIEDDYKQSIRILEYITDKCSDFIRENMVV